MGAADPDPLAALVERDRGVSEGLRAVAVAELPTRHGQFRIVCFSGQVPGQDHLAVVHGQVWQAESVLTRIHSECLTGDVLGSLRCDCQDQLQAALARIGAEERGLLLYLRQEGRGIGLANKLKAYALQDQGMDTVDANQALGFLGDERDYSVAAHMLTSLGVASLRLLTNNPDKVRQLERLGVRVMARLPHALPANPHNRSYLETKQRRLGHDLPRPK